MNCFDYFCNFIIYNLHKGCVFYFFINNIIPLTFNFLSMTYYMSTFKFLKKIYYNLIKNDKIKQIIRSINKKRLKRLLKTRQ